MLSTFATSIFAQDFLIQGWYWDYPKTTSGFLWADTLTNKASDLKNAGFTYIWLPPLSRASFGNSSNGYDPKDLYDLGEYGQGATGFGTRTDVDELITQFNLVGLKAVADVVYNHRDGGSAEDNPPLKSYITSFDWPKADNGYNPFPFDRFRVILPIGGSTGNGAGDYYFKVSSASAHSRFDNFNYRIYMQTNLKGWQDLSNQSELEPNGGSDCDPDQTNNEIELGRNMDAINEDYSGCRTDEFHLSLTAGDFNSAGDTIFIYFSKASSDYSDMRIYGLWSGTRSADIVSELIYQTYTDFTTMPSSSGAMNYENFKPNSTNTTKLDGDWDWLWFFYDYDQNVPATKTALIDWTKWLWNDVGLRGLRMDAVKHFPPEFVGDLLDNLHSNGIDPGLVVGEFYDANTGSLKYWLDQVYTYMDNSTKLSITPRVFDFSLRDALKNASDSYGNDVRNIFTASVVDAQGVNGSNVITFANNHDFRDSTQKINNDPILAYAYLLTNNQVGLPCVFYPDYFEVPGFTNGGLKQEIDALINVHKNYIYGSSARDYLTKVGTTYDPFYFSGTLTTTLVYQLMSTPSGKDVIVGINYAGDPLDMWVGVNPGGLSEGAFLGDQIGNAMLSTLTVSGGRVNIKLPARSYAVWVENENPLPVELTSFTASVIGNSIRLNWQTATEVNNYGFEIERNTPLNPLSRGEVEGMWEKIGFVNGNGNSNSPKSYSFVDNNVSAGSYSYRLKQIDNDGKFEYSKTVEVSFIKPDAFALEQNYPNPFNPTTKIKYTIPSVTLSLSKGDVYVTLKVYDVLGNEIATLVNEQQQPGTYEVEFNADKLSSGVYYYQIISGSFIDTKKMVLLR
ncbi:MAG: T9SS type A sorting domain-containing protein [Ignavibacteriales bacterium]|nr:T9SS type A sorting domain-containing protein [Ignavibacteriales bacterium]